MGANDAEDSRPLLKPRNAATLWFVGIGAVALLVLLAREAVDVLALIALCTLILAVERTLGDWFVDAVGPFGRKTIFFAFLIAVFGILFAMGSVR